MTNPQKVVSGEEVAPGSHEAEDRSPPRSLARRWWALGLLCVVNFMVVLDAQIVILAVPQIRSDLGFSPDGVQWVMSAYLLSFGGLLLLGGRVGDLVGRRRVFIWGAALFGVSSLSCGLAWTPAALVVARVAQGMSAAMMAPTALAILMTTFAEGAERNKALALWAGLGGLGATSALLLGGSLSDAFGWEAIFFLNVPIAALLLTASPLLLTESRSPGAGGYDPAGALAITGALTLAIYLIVDTPGGAWTAAPSLLLAVTSGLLLVVFVWTEGRSSAPLVPLGMFRSRRLVGGNLVMLLAAMSAFGVSITLSQYVQGVLGYSPLRFGLATTAMTSMSLVGSYLAQRFTTSIGVRSVAAASAALLATGSLLLSGVPVEGRYLADLFGGLVVFGTGLGAATVAGAIAALSGVADADAGVASGTNTAAFQIGGALGVAVVTSVTATHGVGGGAPSAVEVAQDAFRTCAVISVIALTAAITLLHDPRRRSPATGALDTTSAPGLSRPSHLR